MTKDKLESLKKYLAAMKDKLQSGIPAKHKNHPETYTRFIKNEIETVEKQLEVIRLEGIQK